MKSNTVQTQSDSHIYCTETTKLSSRSSTRSCDIEDENPNCSCSTENTWTFFSDISLRLGSSSLPTLLNRWFFDGLCRPFGSTARFLRADIRECLEFFLTVADARLAANLRMLSIETVSNYHYQSWLMCSTHVVWHSLR